MNTAESIRKAASLLFREGQVVELRALGDRTYYGYYTDYDKLARDAAILDTTPGISGVYVTLNTVNPALLSRCANRIKTAAQKEPQTADEDIIHRSWLPVDIDPARPAGISSSDAEHRDALRKAETIHRYLSELGFPEPIIADSGNGAHLLYEIDLSQGTENSALIRQCLKSLDQFFSDAASAIDTSVSNPARIWKLYGTKARKGDHTLERPHRTSAIISFPDTREPVPKDALIHLASRCIPEPDKKSAPAAQEKTYGAPDLATWLTEHGFSYTEKPYHAGRLFIFDECPFSTAHTDGAYAIQFENGAIFAGCHHNTCGGNTQRWQELKARFEEPSDRPKRDYEEWSRQKSKEKARKKAIRDGTIPELNTPGCTQEGQSISQNQNHTQDRNRDRDQNPDQSRDLNSDPISNEEPDVLDEVTRILHEGDPIRYLLDTFAKAHEGDQIVAKCLLMSLASRAVINSKGLHVLVTGESGKGKSHAFESMMDLIPQEYCLSGRLTDKALFYQDNLRKGSIICLDDVSLSLSMQETLKGVTTSFKKPFIYRTVDKDRNSQTRVIPERCLWWIAKVEGTGDDQVWNRMLTVWIDDSQNQDDLVLVRELTEAARPASPLTTLSREVRVCRALWNQLASVSVRIPYATQIRFTNSKNRRNSSMLLDLVRSAALLHQYQRERVETGGIIEILATVEDFEAARKIYLQLNGDCGGQLTKLTSTEQSLVSAVRTSGMAEFTVKQLQKLIGRSQSTVSRLLAGNPERQDHVGLLEKCPPLSFYDRSEPREDGGYQRGRVYTWDYEMDVVWSAGVLCWLEESGKDDTDTGPDDTHTPDDYEGHEGHEGHEDHEDHDDGDDRDSMHVCTPMQALCTPECIETENKNDLVSDMTNENLNSPSAMHSPGRACTPSENEIRSQYVPENNAYTTTKSLITQSFREKEYVPVSSSMHDGVHTACIDVHTMHTSENQAPENTKPDKKLRIEEITPDMFLMTRGRRTQPCEICGKEGATYREKGTASDSHPHKRRMICERCYSKAVSREVLTYRALPGVLPLEAMKRTDRSLGRCSLCNLHPVTWFDEETKIGLCERCYYRERFSAPPRPSGGRV